MFAGAYLARWVMTTVAGRTVHALTFVINPQNPRYTPGPSAERTAQYISHAEGALGACLEYFRKLQASLAEAGVVDPEVQTIASHL